AGLVATAAGLLVLSVVMSVALLVPINSRAAHWTPESAPADWREQLGRWDRLHYLRVAVIVTAFLLLVIALV
ncbi:anthrone oxygenase family protein, partial [Kitasatospora sp. NPDC058263]